MKRTLAEFLKEMLEDADPKIIENYSGRGMLGSPTVALGIGLPPERYLAGVIAAIFSMPEFSTDDYPDIKWDEFELLNFDQLGRGYVIY